MIYEKIMVKDIKIEDFDYHLPDERIPRHPLSQRDSCLLLRVERSGEMSDHTFAELPDLLPDHSLLVCNDTRVINARLSFRKPTGSRIEIFLLDPVEPADYVLTFQTTGKCVWNCLVGNLKKWKEDSLKSVLSIKGHPEEVTLSATRLASLPGNTHRILFEWDNEDVNFAEVVETLGNIPIPPYLKRDTEECDERDYQTVYADAKGSVAAPTAGLHFTDELFSRLHDAGIDVAKLTLHVGAGTFQPVKSDTIGEHPMHTETFTITADTVRRLLRQKEEEHPVVAVGTTSVRTLESLPLLAMHLAKGDDTLHVSQWEAYDKSDEVPDAVTALRMILSRMEELGVSSLTATTAIMIAPGFRWRIVNGMVTNFHQPQSTLLLLVSSFLGTDPGRAGCPQPPMREAKHEADEELWRKVYHHALDGDYRFLSYGDACLFV